jgi:hypothetical protein
MLRALQNRPSSASPPATATRASIKSSCVTSASASSRLLSHRTLRCQCPRSDLSGRNRQQGYHLGFPNRGIVMTDRLRRAMTAHLSDRDHQALRATGSVIAGPLLLKTHGVAGERYRRRLDAWKSVRSRLHPCRQQSQWIVPVYRNPLSGSWETSRVPERSMVGRRKHLGGAVP